MMFWYMYAMCFDLIHAQHYPILSPPSFRGSLSFAGPLSTSMSFKNLHYGYEEEQNQNHVILSESSMLYLV